MRHEDWRYERKSLGEAKSMNHPMRYDLGGLESRP